MHKPSSEANFKLQPCRLSPIHVETQSGRFYVKSSPLLPIHPRPRWPHILSCFSCYVTDFLLVADTWASNPTAPPQPHPQPPSNILIHKQYQQKHPRYAFFCIFNSNMTIWAWPTDGQTKPLIRKRKKRVSRMLLFVLFVCEGVGGGLEVWRRWSCRVGCPPVHNDIETPRQLFTNVTSRLRISTYLYISILVSSLYVI